MGLFRVEQTSCIGEQSRESCLVGSRDTVVMWLCGLKFCSGVMWCDVVWSHGIVWCSLVQGSRVGCGGMSIPGFGLSKPKPFLLAQLYWLYLASRQIC